MNKKIFNVLIVIGLMTGYQSCQEKSENNQEQGKNSDIKGYVMKVDEGEIAGVTGTLVKVSPKTGSQGSELLHTSMPKDFPTGIHFHQHFDEIFYVLDGTARTTLDGQEYQIEPGDIVFVPVGHDHSLFVTSTEMNVLIFLDKPGLADEFREEHRKFLEKGESLSLEEVNQIANKYGTVYKTLK